jgi:hypothetical protein
MSSNIYTAGLNNVGSYQVSGIPYAATPTTTSIDFPYVTRWVNIINSGSSDVEVGFSSNGLTGDDKFVVRGDSETGPLELKITQLYFSTTTGVSVVAGLTNLPVSRVDNISPSGSNWSGSAGVG